MKYVVLNLANFPKKPVKSYCPASEHIYVWTDMFERCACWECVEVWGVSDSERTYDSECVWVSLGGDVWETLAGDSRTGERCEVGVFVREACVRDEWGDLGIGGQYVKGDSGTCEGHK